MTLQGDLQFSLTIKYDDFIMRDHRVHQTRIMPGVTFLDMLLRYLRSKGANVAEVAVRRILFLEPIAVTQAYDQKVRISFKDQGGSYKVTAHSMQIRDGKPLADSWSENMRCEIHFVAPIQSVQRKPTELAIGRRLDLDEVYSVARSVEIHHYEFMKGLGEVFHHENHLLAHMHLSDLAQNYLPHFFCHPAYLDAATCVFLLFREPELARSFPYIPLFIEEFRAFSSPGRSIHVYIPKSAASLSSPDLMSGDIEILDQHGNLQARFTGLNYKRIRSAELITRLQTIKGSPIQVAPPAPTPRKAEPTSTMGSTRGLILEQVKGLVSGLLDGRAPAPDAPFYDQGLTSTDLLDLVQNLERLIGEALYPTLLFEYTTINELVDYLETEHGSRFGSNQQPAPVAGTTPATSTGNWHQVLAEMIRPMREGEPGALAYDTPFYEQGLTSTDLLELVRTLETLVKQELYPTLLFEYTSIDALAQWLQTEYGAPQKAPDGEISHSVQQPAAKVYFSSNLSPAPLAPVSSSVQVLEIGGAEPVLSGSVHLGEGSAFSQINKNNYKIRLHARADYQQVLEQAPPFQYIVYHMPENPGPVADQIRYSYQAMLALTQALMSRRQSGQTGLLFVYKHNNPIAAGMSGFIRTLKRENPRFRYRMVAFTTALTPQQLTTELLSGSDEELEVLWRDGSRSVRNFTLHQPVKTANLPFKQGGVYLITGGAGGLGLIVAEFLAKTYKARVVLCGRSPLDEQRRKQLKSITGALYHQADINNPAEVAGLLDRIRQEFKAINGIVHSAGILRDAFIVTKNPADAELVMAPKIQGTLLLDQLTAGDALDFFVTFSSTAAILGIPGQSDYAFANAFMDAWSAEREEKRKLGQRSGRTLSINWPLWKNGGMQVDAATEARFEREYGIRSLETEDGLETISLGLASDLSHIGILCGDQSRISQVLGIGQKPAVVPTRVSSTRITDSIPPANREIKDIAIIGLSGRYPMAPDLERFWSNLVEGRDCITEIPRERWDYRPLFGPGEEGKTYARWGGFLDEIDRFDPLFFNITPREARLLDPQERLFLQTVHHTMEDAGLAQQRGSATGVFVGVMWSQYQILGAEESLWGVPVATNFSNASIANRVSYNYDFRGPCMAIDTMCSSSLVALSLACDALQKGDCEMAIAGGVNLSLHPSKYTYLTNFRMLSSDGRCRSFGEGGDGYVPGEGVGALLLKPLDQAIADGNRIYAVVKGSAINHGGRSGGFTVPNPRAQGELIAEGLRKTGIDPRTLSYIETHGTGTSLGDPIEISGLQRAFAPFNPENGTIPIGSVKSNIGHLEAAAGIAGITKILLQMQKGQLVPSLHSQPANSKIDFSRSPFRVQRQLETWKTSTHHPRRRAAISSFGAGGTNAFVILEEFPQSQSDTQSSGEQLFVLSARDPQRLQAYARSLCSFLASGSGTCTRVEDRIPVLCALTAAVLKVEDISAIDPDNEFSDYGMDPLHINELARRIEERWQAGLNPSDLLTCGTLTRIAARLPLEKEKGHNLADLAWTSRCGRAAMEHRLAVITSSTSQLQESLQAWLTGARPAGLYTGEATESRTFSPVADLHATARQWVSGGNCQWQDFGPRGQIVSMPGYPFANERYWISDREPGVVPEGFGHSSALHPLLGLNTSDFDLLRFTTHLTGKELFLDQHRLSETRLLPGVAILEMAREAVERASGRKVTGLGDVLWSAPIFIKTQAIDLHIALFPNEAGNSADFEVFSSENLRYSSGTVLLGSTPVPAAPFHEIEGAVLDSQTVYQDLAATGLNYGPAFQTIQKLVCNMHEATSRVSLSETVRADFGRYVLHPCLTDGALQSVMGLLPDPGDRVFLPIAVGSVDLLGEMTPQGFVSVRIAGGTGDTRLFHITLYNDQQQAAVAIHNFAVRAADPLKMPNGETMDRLSYREDFAMEVPQEEAFTAEESQKPEDGTERLFFVPTLKEITRAKTFVPPAGPLLLFIEKDALKAEILNLLGDQTPTLLTVRPSGKFAENHGRFTMDPANPDHYVQLFERLTELNLMPTAAIHLWSRKQFSSDIGPVQAQIRKSLFSLFLLAQTMLQRRALFPILFVSFYGERNPLYSAINAQIKSLAFEEPGLEISHLSFEGQPNEDLELAEILLRESGQKQRERALLYRDGKFYAQGFAEIAQPAQTANPDPGGVYLITGGMGGLGYLFARHLAEQGKAKLVLSGRSPLDEVRKQKLDQLKALNCEAIYISGDIADKKHVHELTQTARKEFGHIDGVFHAAGVLRDGRIAGKTLEQWTDVLGPKILGTIFLDEATKDDDLRYFICFSSGSAVTGNIGQVDYATGNGFMDAWCSRRQEMTATGKRKGIALSVNWPLWQDGGMDVDERGKQYLRKTFGLVPLTTESGLKAFYQALTPGGHVVFSEGDGNQIRDIMGVPAPQPKASQARPEKTSLSGSVKTRPTATRPEPAVKEQKIQAPLAGTSTSAREEALKLLRSMISKISEVPIARIGAEVPLEDFGIDSIMIMDLTAALETRFGKLPKTLFFEYQTAGQLADYFLSHFGQSFQSSEAPAETALAPTPQKDQVAWPAASPVGETRKRSLRRLINSASPDLIEHPKARMPIAIVGLSGRYPMAPDLDIFWQNLAAGKDCIEEIPAERWFHDRYYDPERDKPGKTYAKWGGFLKDIDAFDPLFFNIAPAEAELMDPQERLFLQTAWSAMEDAGYTREQLSRDPVGVFVGVMWGQYQLLYREDGENSVAPTSSYASIANRVSYWFNLSGPSMAVDTMCSSSLTALHLACRSLRDGECETAIAGGVNLMTHPQKYIQLARDSFAASDGRCRAFGEGGDGYVPGEGVGAVLLKPLEKALKDGDHVYGIIRATAINHGGKTNGYTVPNPRAQGAVISRALEESGIHPDSISYVEAHGTGTSLGDPIEINGLQRAWGLKTDRTQYCAIGSVKSNIGHLESAAGIAGLTKVLLQMKHGKLLPSIHSEKLNPNIDFHTSPFVVQRKLADWVCVGLRRAALSSFGAGGANAHVILEEYRQEPLAHDNTDPLLFVLSARTESRLRAQARNLLTFLKKNQPNLLDAAYTLHLCREAMDERLAIVASDHESLVTGLDNWLRGEASESVHRGHNLVHADSAMLSEDEEGREFIRALIRSRKMNKVARLWVSGVDFDWQTLYPETCRRTSLPTYPFEQSRFWVTQQDGLLFFPTVNQGQVDVLHPLLHTNISTLREQKYATRLDGTRFFLAEHRVDGRKILPGACIIELARMAGCLAGDGEVTAVCDLLWAAPIVVNGAITEIHTVLYPERGGRIAFEIRSNDERPIIHAEGELQLNTSQESEMPSLDFGSILKRCPRVVDEEQTYNWFWEAGFDYGPSFTTIREMRLGQEEALVKLELPAVRSQDKRFGWHPSLIDGALQSVLGLVRAQDPDNLYLPHGIGEIAVFRPLPAILYVHVTRAPGRRDDALSYDLQLAAEDGTLVGRLLRFDLRMRAQAPTGKKISDAETLFFRPLWERSPYIGGETMEGNILVFAERGSNWPAMVQARCSDCRCMVVFPGGEFSELSEGGFVIDPKDSDHYQKLFMVLQRRGALPDGMYGHGS